MTWNEAKAYCESLGGHLVTITSEEEQKYVVDSILVPNNVCSWAGGTDEETKGTWKWVTGETFDYENWGGGEPNNYSNNNECYIMMYISGEWNDTINENCFSIYFICEWE